LYSSRWKSWLKRGEEGERRGINKEEGISQSATTKVEELRRLLNCSLEVI
jgi:hypothetical protein